MRAVLYARVSSADQSEKENSIPAQLRLMRDYAKKNNITIIKEYIDDGISGQKENRPAFQEMINHAQKKDFEIILVHKFDRFARKIEISRKIKAQLKKADVNVISITEPIEDSPIGFFQEGLLELLAEYYIKNLSKEVLKGMTEKFLKGQHLGQMPYGYKVVDKKVIVVEEQAQVVRQVFELYQQGWGHWKIAQWLNKNNISTYSGVGRWQNQQVRAILTNKKYIGINEWNGQEVEAAFPVIIDKEMFQQVQLSIGTNAEKHVYRGSNYNKYLLIGLAKCKHCGSNMRAKTNNKNKSCEYTAYICSKASLGRGCDNTKLFRTSDSEKAIEEEIENILSNNVESVNIVVENQIDISDMIEKKLQKLKLELERAKAAYLEQVFSLEEYKSIKDRVERKQKELEENMVAEPKPKNNNENLIKKIKSVWGEYEKSPVEVQKQILQKFIQEIYFKKDKTIEIKFFIQGE